MGIRDFLFRKRDRIPEEDEPTPQVTEEIPASKVESADRPRREINIPDYAVEQWSTAVFDREIMDALRYVDWDNLKVEELTIIIRNATNCLKGTDDDFIRIGFIKYMATVISNQYFGHFGSEIKKSEKTKDFMMLLIQTLADVCTIFGIDFYNLFLAIKNSPIYHERQNDKIVEVYFKYSFRYFTKLWENSKSKFLLDKREDHIKTYEDIMGSFFEEFLENAEPVDIDAIYKFTIQNEEIIETDFFELLAEAISDAFYEPKVFVGKDVPLAIIRHYPDLLINCYINRFNSVIYDMQYAREENDEEKIAKIDDEMCNLIRLLSDYQEYRSEDFTSFFSDTWEWFLGGIVTEFSGYTVSVFSDFLINTVKISKELVDDYIASEVTYMFLDPVSFEEKTLTPIIFEKVYRLLSNDVAYYTIADIKPYLVNSF